LIQGDSLVAKNSSKKTDRFKLRKTPRFKTQGEFVLLHLKRWDVKANEEKDLPSIYAKVVNISEGGLRLDIPADQHPEDSKSYSWPPCVSDTLDLILTGPMLPKPVHIQGEIVNVDSNPKSNGRGVSLKFVNMTDHIKEMIQVGLVRLQLAIRTRKSAKTNRTDNQ
jgi:hypothetical protein